MNLNERPEQSGSDDILMYVADVLRHDIEDISSIVKMLNDEGCIGWRAFWPHDFAANEVADALLKLYKSGLVKALRHDMDSDALVDTTLTEVELANLAPYWFSLTPSGWEAWNKWEPPITAQGAK